MLADRTLSLPLNRLGTFPPAGLTRRPLAEIACRTCVRGGRARSASARWSGSQHGDHRRCVGPRSSFAPQRTRRRGPLYLCPLTGPLPLKLPPDVILYQKVAYPRTTSVSIALWDTLGSSWSTSVVQLKQWTDVGSRSRAALVIT